MPKFKSKSKKRFINFYVDIPIYGTGIRFVVSDDLKRVEKLVDRKYGPGAFNGDGSVETRAASTFRPNKDWVGLVWLRGRPETIRDVGVLAHEIFHAVNHILIERGIELTVDGEAYAYAIEYVTNKAGQKLLVK